MFMKMRKCVSLAMAACLAIGALAGCSDKETSAGDVTEINWWSSDTHSKIVMTELVDEFNNTVGKEKKIKLNYDVQDGGNDRLSIALQNGTEPDLFGCGKLSEYAENEYMVPLDQVPGIEETVAKNSECQQEGSNVYNGKMYFIASGARVYGLAYNKDMFKAAGIVDENGEAKPPVTIAEMIEDAKKLTDASKQQYGIIVPLKWGAWFNCEVQSNAQRGTGLSNGIYNVQDGTYDFNGLKDLAGAFLQMEADGSVYPGEESMDNDPARARFAEGNIGMKFCVSWDAGVWNDQFKAKCDWGVAPAPVVNADEQYSGVKSPIWSACIGKRGLESKGADKIAAVFNYFYSDETMQKLCEQSIDLPYRDDIIEKCDFSNSKTGWKDFAALVSLSRPYQPTLPREMSAYESDANDFVNRVWSGKISLDEWIKERNDISVKAVAEYKTVHPDKDYSYLIIPDYDIRIK